MSMSDSPVAGAYWSKVSQAMVVANAEVDVFPPHLGGRSVGFGTLVHHFLHAPADLVHPPVCVIPPRVHRTARSTAKHFAEGSPDDGNDYLVFRKGKLFYDKDGDGDAAMKLIAKLGDAKLHADDILIG